MADKKISALTGAATPLAGTEVLPIVQSGSTVKVSVANFTSGRAVSAAELTLSTGNLTPSTAAKGIDFTANTPAAGKTSQLLNWYEEGTWTGTLSSTTPPTTPITSTGTYTRIGDLVTVFVAFRNVDNTGAAGNITVSGLPFTSKANNFAVGQVYMARAGSGPMVLDLGPLNNALSIVNTDGAGISWTSTGPGVYGSIQITYKV